MEEENKRIAKHSSEEHIVLDTVRQKLLNESVKVQKQLWVKKKIKQETKFKIIKKKILNLRKVHIWLHKTS